MGDSPLPKKYAQEKKKKEKGEKKKRRCLFIETVGWVAEQDGTSSRTSTFVSCE